MSVNQDFEDLLKCLNDVRARYFVVGAYAVIYYTEPRYTKDMDLWIEASSENAKKVFHALKKFGAPLKGIEESDFCNEDLVYQVGIEPNRIDILMKLKGVDFKEAWKRRKLVRYGDQKVIILNKEDLIENKRQVGRPQDQIDLTKLLKTKK